MNRRAALLFLLYSSAILYLSLSPVRNGVPPTAAKLLWTPIFDRGQEVDFILNIAFYVPLGAAAFVALRSGVPAIPGATLICSLISLAVEFAQLSIPSRHGNLRDWAANSFGALLGTGLAFASRRVRAVHPDRTLFLGLWIAWQGFMLLRRTWSVADAGRELAGLLVLAMVFHGRVPRVAALAFLVWLTVEELRPFDFQNPPGAFSWIPFNGWFQGSPESYYGSIAAKLFLYTAVVWMIRRSGARMLWALAIPGIILAAGEWAQRYLPGRSPEITDLVLLAAGGALLAFTGSDSRQAPPSSDDAGTCSD